MAGTNLRRAIARTPLAPVAAFPTRLSRVARYDAKLLGLSARWLFTSLDINPAAGYLAQAKPWSTVVDLVIGDSIGSIGALSQPVDMFLHDSDHSVEHERREFEAVGPKLADGAVLLTDNVTKTDVLARYAEQTGRRFLAYREQPARHWFPGDGIGVAW